MARLYQSVAGKQRGLKVTVTLDRLYSENAQRFRYVLRVHIKGQSIPAELRDNIERQVSGNLGVLIAKLALLGKKYELAARRQDGKEEATPIRKLDNSQE